MKLEMNSNGDLSDFPSVSFLNECYIFIWSWFYFVQCTRS